MSKPFTGNVFRLPTAILAANGASPRRFCAIAMASCAAMLVGCASTPLPAWPTASAAGRVPVSSGRVATVYPSAPVSSGAVTSPVYATPPPDQAVTAPYGPEVAARFPDPAVAFATPGLQPGRAQFTSNVELRNWLSSLTDPGSHNRGVQAALVAIGTSQQGESINAVVLTKEPSGDARSIAESRKPTVLIIGQQHGDEPAGAEAALVVARELAGGLLEPLLDRINVVIVPRANPDGAATMRRVTSNGIDLNRDHLVLKTPEAQSLARLIRDYRPLVVLDAHEYTVVGRFLEKFGAIQRYDALLQYATTPNLHEFITKAADEWYQRPVAAALAAQGLTSESYYTTSVQPDDRLVSMGGVQPDTGRNVNGLRNAVSLLVETRGVGIGRLHIQRRVQAQVIAMTAALKSTAERADNLLQIRSYVERDESAKACRGASVLSAAQTRSQKSLVMLDPTTGADKPVNVEWASSLKLTPQKSRARPCGYWLSAQATDAVARLQLLGLNVLRVAETGSLLTENYREKSRVETARDDVRGVIADAEVAVRVEVDLVRSATDVSDASFYVSLSQPLANLAIAALEPDTQNGFFANRIVVDLNDVARVVAPPSLAMEELP